MDKEPFLSERLILKMLHISKQTNILLCSWTL